MARGRRLCLAIDLGTGGPKVGLVTLDGVLMARTHEITTTRFAADGTAVQDAAHLVGAGVQLHSDPPGT